MRIYLVDHDRLAANRYRHWDERISLFSWENKLASQPSAPAATVDHVHWIKSDCENKLSCENKLNCETEVDNPSRSTTFGIMARDYIPSISSSLMTLLPCACLFSWENKLWVCSLKRTNSLKITLCNYFRVRLLSDTLKDNAPARSARKPLLTVSDCKKGKWMAQSAGKYQLTVQKFSAAGDFSDNTSQIIGFLTKIAFPMTLPWNLKNFACGAKFWTTSRHVTLCKTQLSSASVSTILIPDLRPTGLPF